MVRRELYMQPEPGEFVQVVLVIGTVIRLFNVRNGALGVADCPTGVIKLRTAGRRIRRDSYPPSFVQNQRRAKVGRVHNRRFLSCIGNGLSLWGVAEAGKGMVGARLQ